VARAFCPAHITGFFTAHITEDPMRSGSTGAGFTLDVGAVTTARPAERSQVLLDGRTIDASTTLRALELSGAPPMHVETRWNLPVGSGLSASGAGALSAVLAANQAADLGHPYGRMVAAAHRAEVERRTGLGSVVAQSTGGLVMRLAPGVPPAVDRIPVPATSIYVASAGGVPTPRVLSDAAARREINEHGRRALAALLRRPTLKEFFALSRRFAAETGLLQGRVLDAVEAVEAVDAMASVAMLGHTVFATTPRGLSGLGRVYRCRIACLPACVLEGPTRALAGRRRRQ